MGRKPSDIRLRLIHAARRRFLQDGVDGASLRDIAKTARTNIGMVYYYFKSKDALFLEVVEEVYTGLLVDLQKTLSPELDFDERIKLTYARMADLSDDEFVVMRIILREALVSSQRLGRVMRRFSAGHVALVISTLQQAMLSGRIREDVPPPTLLPCMMGLALGVVFARRLREATLEGKAEPPFPPPDPVDVARTAAALLVRGSAAKGKR